MAFLIVSDVPATVRISPCSAFPENQIGDERAEFRMIGNDCIFDMIPPAFGHEMGGLASWFTRQLLDDDLTEGTTVEAAVLQRHTRLLNAHHFQSPPQTSGQSPQQPTFTVRANPTCPENTGLIRFSSGNRPHTLRSTYEGCIPAIAEEILDVANHQEGELGYRVQVECPEPTLP